jgi:hypothetical protein
MRVRTLLTSAAPIIVIAGLASPISTATASTPHDPPASACTKVNSDFSSTDLFVMPKLRSTPARPSDPATVQYHDVSTKVCEVRTSKTKMTVTWSWALHHGVKLADGVIPIYVFNCGSQQASKAKASMNFPKGTKRTSGKGTTTFAVTRGQVYQVGFAGDGEVDPPNFDVQYHFRPDPPGNIIPFAGRNTSCL